MLSLISRLHKYCKIITNQCTVNHWTRNTSRSIDLTGSLSARGWQVWSSRRNYTNKLATRVDLYVQRFLSGFYLDLVSLIFITFPLYYITLYVSMLLGFFKNNIHLFFFLFPNSLILWQSYYLMNVKTIISFLTKKKNSANLENTCGIKMCAIHCPAT